MKAVGISEEVILVSSCKKENEHRVKTQAKTVAMSQRAKWLDLPRVTESCIAVV